jgi:predicted AlkP superfamily phosphohydrolase/phosphomutase
MQEGRLPNFSMLAGSGAFTDLETTCPAISPVAWSSFATGVNPGKHNIFDFLNRDFKTYLPRLSSTSIGNSGKHGLPGRRSRKMSLLRKSRPFWKVLGEHGVFSTILRVPITFPPESFYGLSLSAMCTPDIQGTQGTFVCYETVPEGGEIPAGEQTPEEGGGQRIPVTVINGCISTELPGPPGGKGRVTAPMKIKLSESDGSAVVEIAGQKIRLEKGKYSDWINVWYRVGLRRAWGICRFLLVSVSPGFKLYVTPINLDPARPAMPISHPRYYSAYLAKLIGPFATLGLAEDTWALSEGVIDDRMYLEQTGDIHEERKRMFFESLKRCRNGACCCVFDMPDRIQHMFLRSASGQKPGEPEKPDEECAEVIDGMYAQMDSLVGETMEKLKHNDTLFVISDHGFSSFRRGVHLNRWLEKEGFLVTHNSSEDRGYLTNIDWKKTRAYSFGLAGIYLNVKGRESSGIVEESRRETLKQEITAKLKSMKDPETDMSPVHNVYDGEQVYSGPYRENGPDLIVGYENGYRASWSTAVGKVEGEVFEDNTKAWSGDHCIDRDLVPGVFFSNRRILSNHESIHIMDMAPTVLKLFGIEKPSYMDGKALEMEVAGK